MWVRLRSLTLRVAHSMPARTPPAGVSALTAPLSVHLSTVIDGLWPITAPADGQTIESQGLKVNRDAMPGMGQTSPSNLGASLRKADIDYCRPLNRSTQP